MLLQQSSLLLGESNVMPEFTAAILASRGELGQGHKLTPQGWRRETLGPQ